MLDHVRIALQERRDARAIIFRGTAANEPRDEAADHGTDPATKREVVRFDVRDEAVRERVERLPIHVRTKAAIDIEAEFLELTNALLLPDPLLHAVHQR